MGPRKGFKVTDAERRTRVGIAAETIADLRRKTLEKFKLPEDEEIRFQTRDGLPINDDDDGERFQELKSQTLLIWTRRGERAETDAEILYKTIREVNLDFLTTGEKVQEFFTEQMKHKVYRLAEVLKGVEDDKARLSTKEDDREWFTGIDSRSKTKEEYMFRRCQDRIKTYYYKTKDDVGNSGGGGKQQPEVQAERVGRVFAQLQRRLKEAQYFGCYFDRRRHSTTTATTLCDATGTFRCQGRWDRDDCDYERRHAINPYRSREDRVCFQTWNLDHGIERARVVVPAIKRALAAEAENRKSSSTIAIDFDLIFDDLFTLKNLKLVHIVCHDKGTHQSVDLDRYIKKIENFQK